MCDFHIVVSIVGNFSYDRYDKYNRWNYMESRLYNNDFNLRLKSSSCMTNSHVTNWGDGRDGSDLDVKGDFSEGEKPQYPEKNPRVRL